MSALPTFEDVQAAAARLAGQAHRTPVLRSGTADALGGGARFFFKCENFQRMGAFKFRGGYNALARFTPQQRQRGALAFSSGNHAQAVALAARLLGMPATILMPQDAPAAKLAATRGYGAEVITFDRFKEDREALARRLAEERGMTLVPPYDHADVIAGQGTAALELFQEVGELDHLFVCLGGGGLLGGCALAARAMSPRCKVYGVEPEAGNDGQRSFRSGELVHIEVPRTIADGAQTQHLGQLTFPLIRHNVDDIFTASDAQLVDAMRFYASRMKMLVEPTGCLSLAGALACGLDLQDARVGVLISGGNVDLARFAQLAGS
ncbi:threo-3-hydroxy-L-aspartate ammonia-lyase [Ramlibacter tataouinensis]|uniref:Threonine dehydratase catabolic (Threonine deaminase)-like protein n=1 Tax=Ramlibacter tataouinensis (strain ATCC BAA-407 / DSM 14655 / LMG 21543 / TTB310) TaxID=365046 RepID=F5XZ47_RAMTT|nr:threo-3-hydroxy-L-aspartate ammonia-lyase [Ramlibacter tataouinensis]AEG93217.1 threonine dehydratase catabolic (Threonine deaminase)-like protein [Ramlibacter tataouinensis TTB310]